MRNGNEKKEKGKGKEKRAVARVKMERKKMLGGIRESEMSSLG